MPALSADLSRRRPARFRWGLWLLLTIACGLGLQHYRVDNPLAGWIPERQSLTPAGSYLLVGFDQLIVDSGDVESALARLPSVGFSIGPHSIETSLGIALGQQDDCVIGLDGNYVGVYCMPDEGVTDQQLVAEVRSELESLHSDAERVFALAGPAAFHIALNEASQWRLDVIMMLITVMGAAGLWLTTGSIKVAASSIFAISCAQIILLGLASWLGVPIDMSLSLVPPLMMALGYSFAVHVALRSGSGSVLVLCGITTTLGIASFGLGELQPIRTFALWGSIGVVIVWLAVMSLVPRRNQDAGDMPDPQRFVRPMQLYLQIVTGRMRWVIVGFTIVITIITTGSATRLRVDPDPLGYFPADAKIVRDTNLLEQRLTGTLPLEVTITGEADFKSILDDSPFIRTSVDLSIFSTPGQHTYLCLAESDSLAKIAKASDAWQQWATEQGVSLEVRGVAAQLLEVRRLMMQVALLSIPCMIVVAGIVAALLSRSILWGLLGAWVNLVPLVGLILVAVILDIPLELPALMVGAISIGVGIDDTIHLLWSVRRRGSVDCVLRECLRPCLGSSLIAVICLAAFALSPFQPTMQFGLLMATALLFATAADLLLLPSLLALKSC